MTSEGFKPAISATKRPKTYVSDRAATGIGKVGPNTKINLIPSAVSEIKLQTH
jgi:hypothetical protein